jgi:uncharacterized phage protein (TIGR02220 family)
MPTDDHRSNSRRSSTTSSIVVKINRSTKKKRAPKPRERGFCEPCTIVVNAINRRAGTKFRSLNPDGTRPRNLRDLHRQHQESGLYSCLRIVRVKGLKWINTEQEDYYRPSTLFRPVHFDEYLNEPDPEERHPRLLSDTPEQRRRNLEDYNRIMREQGKPEVPLPGDDDAKS